MREIKFRAWDKENKKMISHNQLFAIDCSNEYPFLALIAGHYENALSPLSVELMQFTGVKDKNSKDIYEGDILEVNHHWDDYDGCSGTEKFLGVAIFKEGAFQVSRFEKMEFYLASSIIISNEIKGNIYENPELLEVEQ